MDESACIPLKYDTLYYHIWIGVWITLVGSVYSCILVGIQIMYYPHLDINHPQASWMGGEDISHEIFKTVVFVPPNIFQDFAFKNVNKLVRIIQILSNLLAEGNKLLADDFICVHLNECIQSLLKRTGFLYIGIHEVIQDCRHINSTVIV